MKKTFKLLGLYLLVTLVVAVGIVFLLPMPVNANSDDWEDPLPPAPTNHLLDIVGNLMNLTDANIAADLTIDTGDATIAVTANVDLQATAGFADVMVAGDLGLTLNDFATNLHITYADQTVYADWNNLHLQVSVPALIDGLPALLGLFGVDFTMPDFSELDVNALLGLLENYTETTNDHGFDVVLTVAGCDLELTCDANYNLQRAVIPGLTFGDTTLAGTIDLTVYATPLAVTVPDEPYVDVPQLVNLFTNLMPVFNQPFSIAGNAKLYTTVDGVPQADNYLSADLGRLAVATKAGLLDQLAIDIAVGGQGELFKTVLNDRALTLGAYFNGDTANYPDQSGVYINFDGLKLFCAKADLADTYRALQNILSLFVSDDILDYTKLFYFNANNDMVFDATVLQNLMGNLTADDIVPMITKYLPYLQGLTLDADNKLTLTVTDPQGGCAVTVTLFPDADGIYHLTVKCNLTEQQRALAADFTLTTLDSVVGVPDDATGYKDVSDIDNLLNAVNNTVRYQEFYFTGTVGVSINLLGKDIPVDVPVEIAINNTDPARGLVVAAHFALPYDNLTSIAIGNLRLLDSAPSAAGKTQKGTRDLYLYYQQGNIYLYRTEQVKISGKWLWSDPVYSGSYEKAVKLTMAEFTDDALYWLLKWGFGFSDSIMQQITNAVANGGDNNEPLNYGDLVHGFSNTDGRYDIVLNLGEITHNKDLKDFTVSITTADNADGQTVVTAVGLDMQIDVGISIVLETRDNGLQLTMGDGVADVTTATAQMTAIDDRYAAMPLADGQTYYETIKGNWQAA